jgi:hypothetical protein
MWVYDGEGGFNIGGEFIILGAGESSLIRYLEAAYSRLNRRRSAWRADIGTAELVSVQRVLEILGDQVGYG